VRNFILPAALMLTACALPGASGMGSSMTAMHPTQEFCASRGLALDATGTRCVTPPASQGVETTGSLPSQTTTTEPPSSPPLQQAPPQPKSEQSRHPQQAQPQPPAQPQEHQPQEKRAGFPVPIEQDALIRPDSPQNSEAASEFAHFVRASGYRCDSISALAPRPGGFTLTCNQSTFQYAIKNKDGRWMVTIE
jgi:outer membrane biosynthesis protein TonB